MHEYGIKPEIQRKIIEMLLVLFPGAKIYLFGSRARKTNREFSDIDLALDCGERIDRLYLGEARSIMEAMNMPYKVDIVDLNAVQQSLRETILKEGVLWHPTH